MRVKLDVRGYFVTGGPETLSSLGRPFLPPNGDAVCDEINSNIVVFSFGNRTRITVLPLISSALSIPLTACSLMGDNPHLLRCSPRRQDNSSCSRSTAVSLFSFHPWWELGWARIVRRNQTRSISFPGFHSRFPFPSLPFPSAPVMGKESHELSIFHMRPPSGLWFHAWDERCNVFSMSSGGG